MAARGQPRGVTLEATEAFVMASRALVGIAVQSLNASPVEVTLNQYRVLILLMTRGDQTVGALADQLRVNASNASRICDRLARLGLVERRRSADDRRAVEITLSALGRDVVEAVRAHRRRVVARVLTRLPESDLAVATRVLADFSVAAGETQWPDLD